MTITLTNGSLIILFFQKKVNFFGIKAYVTSGEEIFNIFSISTILGFFDEQLFEFKCFEFF